MPTLFRTSGRVAATVALSVFGTLCANAAPISPSIDQSTFVQSPIRTVAAKGANGRNVNTVRFAGGVFEKRGRQWAELGTDGKIKFRFDEVKRDQWSVYLNDPRRNVQLQLDLFKEMILYGTKNGAKRNLYAITAVSQKGSANAAAPNMGAPVGSAAALEALRSQGLQCVKAKFGVGYVAKVRWYRPLDVEYEPITRAISIREGGKAVKEENIAVLQESCYRSGEKMFAQISVVNGKFANTAIKLAAGAVITVGGIAAKTVVCVGTVGVGCPVAVAAGTSAIGAGIQLTASLIPDAKTTFYLGSPGKVEVAGTVWSPSFVETRKFGGGKAVNAFCSADSDCANNTCARDSARKGNRSICCPSGREGKYAGHEYCYGLARGKTCWSNAMCTGGTVCKGNLGGARRGTCG